MRRDRRAASFIRANVVSSLCLLLDRSWSARLWPSEQMPVTATARDSTSAERKSQPQQRCQNPVVSLSVPARPYPSHPASCTGSTQCLLHSLEAESPGHALPASFLPL